MTGERFITNSELSTFKECRRKWWMSYVRRLKKRRDDGGSRAARTGTLVHDILESYYRDPHRDASAAIQRLRQVRSMDPDAEQYVDEYVLADTMVEGYFQWLAETGADQELRIVAVEEKITCPAPSPFDEAGVQLLGKLDLFAENVNDGTLLTLDHKTVQTFDRVVALLPMNEQSRHYAAIQGRNNPDRPLQGSIWNMLRKVKRSARSKPPFYMRTEMRWNPQQMRVFWGRLRGEIAALFSLERDLQSGADPHEVAYPTPSTDCTWKCEFYAVCPLMDDPRTDSEALIDAMYVVGDPLARYTEQEEAPDA